MITELLKEYGVRKLNERIKYPKERHWPSDVAKCLRALVYQWRGETAQSPDGRLFFVFNDGELHHKVIVQQLEDTGRIAVVMKEAPLRDKEHNISGKLDALIKFNNKHYVLEIKSINRYGFEEIKRDGPKEDHTIQLQLYLHFVRILYQIDTQEGILLYKCKDTARFYDFIVAYNENVVQDFFGKLKVVEEHLSKGTLPERPYEITDWHCRYCDYKKVCWVGLAHKEIVDLSESELSAIIGELLDIKEKRKSLEEVEETLSKTIKEQLSQKNITIAQIGDYVIELREIIQRRLDTQKLTEHFKEQLEPFYKTTTSKRLDIKESG
ncbi:MAG: Dna2/Cas4 domain-containing protein [Planctomycetota bacterium]|nr:Dna2/Cas4 domain-containing protein [Planctomycetota bacterium]MDI6788728.1 Dna2/Cas4 domain-containing protein [Planctomycetota bacterium]